MLPPDLVLVLFTWDILDQNDVQENYNHGVDVDILSLWEDSTSADVQFLVQPP